MPRPSPLRVAHYYGDRPPRPLTETNPYGPLLADALERQGIEVTFEVRHDEAFLRENAGAIDVLHFHWPHYEYADPDRDTAERQMRDFVERLTLARELGYRVVWTAHNVYPHDRSNREIDHTFRIELCRIASAVIAHCEASADAVRQAFGRTDRLFVIPHGHFIGTHPPELSRMDARDSYGIPTDAYVYGFFGNIQPYKGVEALLDAFVMLPGDPWLVITGGGWPDHIAAIGELIAARDHHRVVYRPFEPFAPGIEIIRALAAADSCPVPFRATTTSGTVVLALSWARPVVAPALGCLPMTVLPGAGVLYDPDEPDALFRALQAVRTLDPVASAEVALASVARFDWDEIAAATIEAYRA
ncbi:MAG TPA: glycosyltransferase family 4 protein [Candidatus Limnocylindrales bacterium]